MSFQLVRETDPYNGVTIHKDECLAHVSKRLKKTLEGGHSYQSSYFGSETFAKFMKKKKRPSRTIRTRARQFTKAPSIGEALPRDKGMKRRQVAQVCNSSPPNTSSDTDNSSNASSEGMCDICD